MRSRTANWFLCKVKYDQVQEDGVNRKVTESYVVEAISFSEAEDMITDYIATYVSGEFDIVEIDRAVFHEVFLSDKTDEEKWYKCKLLYILLDEKTGKEKRSTAYYLVNGSSLESARKNVEEVMSGGMQDYVIVSLSETAILDVYEYASKPNDVHKG